MVLVPVFRELAVAILPRMVVVATSTGAGGSTSGMALSLGSCQEALVPCHADFSLGLLECRHSMAASFPQSGDSRQCKAEAIMCLMTSSQKSDTIPSVYY